MMSILFGALGAIVFVTLVSLVVGVIHVISRPTATIRTSDAETAPAAQRQGVAGFIAGLIVAGVIIAAVVFGLTWLGQPKAVVETPAAAAFKHGFEVKVAAGPWRKVEEVDWAKVKSTFTIPAKGNIHCDQAVNAGKRLHYAIRQPDGVIIEMKPLGEQSPEDKKQEVTAPVGAVVQVTSLTGEELSLLIQY